MEEKRKGGMHIEKKDGKTLKHYTIIAEKGQVGTKRSTPRITKKQEKNESKDSK